MSELKAKILVADDTLINIKIIDKYLTPRGFEIIYAKDGLEAVSKFTQENPDIILMDIMMPNMDGYEATKVIKKLSPNKWVPLLFLSAKSDIDEQVIGLNIGADDYLTKPIDFNMLHAKINAMLRIVEMQRKLDLATQKVKKYVDKYAQEAQLSKDLMQRMVVRKENIKPDKIQIYLDAAGDISGDIVLSYHEENSNKAYFMLADATGHGLTAAISLIPLSQFFYRLAGDGVELTELVGALNTRLYSILPPDRFVAASIGILDESEKTIQVWNGANPIPYLMGKSGNILQTFEESNFSLGVASQAVFSATTQLYHYNEPGELLFFSDGVIDASDKQGAAYGSIGIQSSIVTKAEDDQSYFNQIKSDLNQFRDHENKVDDICILSISCT